MLQTRAGRTWLALPVGAAVSLAFAPFGWWPLAILGTAYLFAAVARRDAAPRRVRGFLFTAGTFLAGTYWLYHSVYEIGHAPIVLTLFVIVIIAAVMGGIYGAARLRARRAGFACTARCAGCSCCRRRSLLIEWFRGWFLSGFPWLALGYTQTDTPLAGYRAARSASMR